MLIRKDTKDETDKEDSYKKVYEQKERKYFLRKEFIDKFSLRFISINQRDTRIYPEHFTPRNNIPLSGSWTGKVTQLQTSNKREFDLSFLKVEYRLPTFEPTTERPRLIPIPPFFTTTTTPRTE